MNIYKDTKIIIFNTLYKNFDNFNKDLESKVSCEQPKNEKFGDISSNIILIASKVLKIEKKEIAKVLISNLLKNKYFEKAEYVEPGFLNLTLSNEFWLDFFFAITRKAFYHSQRL